MTKKKFSIGEKIIVFYCSNVRLVLGKRKISKKATNIFGVNESNRIIIERDFFITLIKEI